MTSLINVNNELQSRFDIHKTALGKPFVWIRKGWQDVLKHPGTSIVYGLIVSVMGAVILLFSSTHIYLIAAAVSGFLLAGPFLAIGLCELSRQQEHGKILNFDQSLKVMSSNGASLSYFAITLLSISMLWFVLSALMLFTFFGDVAPSLSVSLWGNLFDTASHQQILLYIIVGGILACVVFVLSVVSIPAIIDSKTSALDAMLLSVRVVSANLPAMIVWAGLIVALIAVGFITYLLGMIIIYPILGHATWYAYRDLVDVK